MGNGVFIPEKALTFPDHPHSPFKHETDLSPGAGCGLVTNK